MPGVPRTQWYEVTFVYKGGATFTSVMDNVVVNSRGGQLISVEWGQVRKDQARPLHVGVDDVAAVWSRKL